MRVSGPWKLERVETHLAEAEIPLRLACTSRAGWPVVVSLWYVWREGLLWCATQSSSHTARSLKANPRCAFEIAGESPPYHGVRGQGEARLARERGPEILEMLIGRYLGSSNAELAGWLRGRSKTEVAIAIKPARASSWDYSERMTEVVR